MTVIDENFEGAGPSAFLTSNILTVIDQNIAGVLGSSALYYARILTVIDQNIGGVLVLGPFTTPNFVRHRSKFGWFVCTDFQADTPLTSPTLVTNPIARQKAKQLFACDNCK